MLAANATGTVANTATVATPVGITDSNAVNNSATDTDTIAVVRPNLPVLDFFDRANANTLNNGANWSQIVNSGFATIRVNNFQAIGNTQFLPGQAIWNGAGSTFGTQQAASVILAGNSNGTRNNVALFLKASNGGASTPTNFIRVRYETNNGGQVVVATTNTAGLSYPNTLGTFTGVSFAQNDILTAVANADGSVDVWKTTAANVTTYLGHTSTSSFTGTGRIGIQLPDSARVDNFSALTLQP
jgi:hypothetical protein